LRHKFGLEYAKVDSFIKPAQREFDTETVLNKWSELTTASQLRYLYDAHDQFQLYPTKYEFRDTAERVYSKMARSYKFTHVYILEGPDRILGLSIGWRIAFCAREEPVAILPDRRRYLNIQAFPPELA
jgi:hypothetical protein